MIANTRIAPTVPVTDLERAKGFYGRTLGLQEKGEVIDGHLMYEAGEGSDLILYRRAAPSNSDATAFTFMVDDVESEVRALKERGVSFEEYDLPGLKTTDGIATLGEEKKAKGAWFRDPDGNILAISQVRH
jgi:catechol 2,3-dioxygenase-like lactoylglutathione lyase family enzyme